MVNISITLLIFSSVLNERFNNFMDLGWWEMEKDKEEIIDICSGVLPNEVYINENFCYFHYVALPLWSGERCRNDVGKEIRHYCGFNFMTLDFMVLVLASVYYVRHTLNLVFYFLFF